MWLWDSRSPPAARETVKSHPPAIGTLPMLLLPRCRGPQWTIADALGVHSDGLPCARRFSSLLGVGRFRV